MRMENNSTHIVWEQGIQVKFEQLLGKIPIFMRPIAQKKIIAKIEKIIAQNSGAVATEKDLVDAFFSETPFGFHGPVKNDMEEFGIDYKQYGY